MLLGDLSNRNYCLARVTVTAAASVVEAVSVDMIAVSHANTMSCISQWSYRFHSLTVIFRIFRKYADVSIMSSS